MLRSDLIRILQERNPLLHPSSLEAVVKEIIDHMVETLYDDGRIEIRGFGSFVLRHHAPRAAIPWSLATTTGFTSSKVWN